MSHGVESKESVKARNARPARSKQRSATGTLWNAAHPIERAITVKKSREKCKKLGYYAALINKAMNPLHIVSDNIILASDFHIPLHDEDLLELLFSVARENGTKDMAVIGDFWDCGDISRFNSIIESNVKKKTTQYGESEEVKKVLKRILNVFDIVYFCKGNHEDRLSALTCGKMGMRQLFDSIRPGITDREWARRVKVTLDDHMTLDHTWVDSDGDSHTQEWFLCHPKAFRKTNLSVVKYLAILEEKNVFGAHGHQLAQGYSDNGKYRVVDGGGLFDPAALEYVRATTTHAKIKNGFYLLKDGELIPYEGAT